MMDDNANRFSRMSFDDEIKPEKLKKAAGLEKPFEEEMMPTKKKGMMPQEMPLPPAFNQEPLYIKMDVYQRVLGELELLRSNLNALGQANKTLDHSEYNEEENFDKLRRTMKSLHDRLLQVDKILFKS